MKMRRQWSSCDDGGGRNECPAAEAARNPAKLPISAVNFTKEISLTAKDTVQQLPISGTGILCEPCNGKGWLICDFCKGQKTNVKAENKRTYRRCPSCRAVGYVLCSSCKVFKCVTFPNYEDGAELSF